MSVKTVAHLNFRGDAEQALTFYKSVFGGHKVTVTYKQANAVQDPSQADQVMWGQVTAPNGFSVMAYDVPSHMSWDAGEKPFFISVRGDSEDELRDFWERLTEGAVVIQPLSPAAWAPLYGMLKDRFAITWVFDVATPYPGN